MAQETPIELKTLYEELARESYNNSEELLDEANLLFDHEAYHRAYSLGVLSAEEFAKAFLFRAYALDIIKDDRFANDILNHKIKLIHFASIVATGRFVTEHGDAMLEGFQRAKQDPPNAKKILDELFAELKEDTKESDKILRLFGDGIDNTVSFPPEITASGKATVVALNASEAAPSTYTLGGYVIPPKDQLYITRTWALDAAAFPNLTRTDLNAFQTIVLNQTAICDALAECKQMDQRLLCPENAVFASGTVLLNPCDFLGSNSSGNQWSFRDVTSDSEVTFASPPGVTYKGYRVYHTVEYRNESYITTGFEDLSNISYSKAGLLLYASTHLPGGLVEPELPSSIVRTYGITLLSKADGTELSVMLVGICKHAQNCA